MPLLPLNRSSPGVTFDGARDEMVVFGGWLGQSSIGDTWAWNSSNGWTRRATSGPSARYGPAMAYDSIRERIVLFGGSTETNGRHWEWDGTSWINVPTTAPGRTFAGMVFDSHRARMVLFGGWNNYFDTWEFDGNQWSQVATIADPGPGPREQFGFAYDPIRQRSVLFGGGEYFGSWIYYSDTWEWDGTAWTQMATTGPSARARVAMAFDPTRGTVVLTGGNSYQPATSDRWEWDGSTWTQLSSAPVAISSGVAVIEAGTGRHLISAGDVGNASVLDIRGFDQNTWTHDYASMTRQGAMAFDELGGSLIFFSHDGTATPPAITYRWTDSGWVVAALGGPSPRATPICSVGASGVLMFGGYGFANSLSDTWLWNGTAWNQIQVSGPPARVEHSMAFDRARGRVVLYGGRPNSASSTNPTGDTWEWDGSAWMQVASSGPGNRSSAEIAYDEVRQRTVLTGGFACVFCGWLPTTWEWDGTTWTQRSAAGVPQGTKLVYDQARGRVIGIATSAVYEWTGAAWMLTGEAAPTILGSKRSAGFDRLRHITIFQAESEAWSRQSQPAVIFAQQPASTTVAPGGTAQFHVSATSTPPVTYAWRKDGVLLSDGTTPGGSQIAGTMSPQLTITGVTGTDAGMYDCVVASPCGLAASSAAELVIGGAVCYANCDNSSLEPVLNVADFSCFLQKFAAGDGYANCDQSTQPPVLNVADFSCFLQKFAAGCR